MDFYLITFSFCVLGLRKWNLFYDVLKDELYRPPWWHEPKGWYSLLHCHGNRLNRHVRYPTYAQKNYWSPVLLLVCHYHTRWGYEFNILIAVKQRAMEGENWQFCV